jgi:hypothetical protein
VTIGYRPVRAINAQADPLAGMPKYDEFNALPLIVLPD